MQFTIHINITSLIVIGLLYRWFVTTTARIEKQRRLLHVSVCWPVEVVTNDFVLGIQRSVCKLCSSYMLPLLMHCQCSWVFYSSPQWPCSVYRLRNQSLTASARHLTRVTWQCQGAICRMTRSLWTWRRKRTLLYVIVCAQGGMEDRWCPKTRYLWAWYSVISQAQRSKSFSPNSGSACPSECIRKPTRCNCSAGYRL